ncbi:GntR family transcriptional regulator [Niallia nealsonii]|uniref:GntR family transcriptional regulator n=1 Tax=Niallia nealsonii TaxID=115979 RepID=A0A2N0Z0Y2_9BACI|nr:GntR family transcriptional regulator [Niallia nealsonii]PKG23161.1 GntR family transcriptional regulator [Niallia nealsonii]
MKKYEAISAEIKRRIMEKEYSTDSPIPDEISLAKEFACSRMTMKKALDVLVMEGLLYRKRGHGTFIVKSAIDNKLVNVGTGESLGLTNLLKNKKIESKIVLYEVMFPNEEVASHLSITTKTPVYHIVRLRIVDGEPYVLEDTYMPSDLISGLTEEILHFSIYQYIKEKLGLTIAGSHRKIRACKSNELDQQYLNCASDDPILEVEQVSYLNTGTPFEYSFSRHRYDKFFFTAVSILKP